MNISSLFLRKFYLQFTLGGVGVDGGGGRGIFSSALTTLMVYSFIPKTALLWMANSTPLYSSLTLNHVNSLGMVAINSSSLTLFYTHGIGKGVFM
jgi:hypothetical protein